MFVTALESGPPNLASFLSTQASFNADQYLVCDNLPVLVQAEPAMPPALVLLPRRKPSQMVAPALGLTLRSSLDLSVVSF